MQKVPFLKGLAKQANSNYGQQIVSHSSHPSILKTTLTRNTPANTITRKGQESP